MKDSFKFFRNMRDIIKSVPRERQLELREAIEDYVFDGVEPEDWVIKAILQSLKPSLDYQGRGAPTGNKNAQKNNSEELKTNKTIQNNSKQKKQIETKKQEAETEARSLKQETEAEDIILLSSDKSSESKNSGKPPFEREERKYAFEGKIIKLTQADFDRWKRAYPDLNLWGELMLRDDWLAKQPPDGQKNWFMTTSQYFIKQNAKRKAQNAEIEPMSKTNTKHTIGDWL